MNSPHKKRKRNDGSSRPMHGLDYFFAKQTVNPTSKEESATVDPAQTSILTDEEYARKLQAEWDRELEGARIGQAQVEPDREDADMESARCSIDDGPEAGHGQVNISSAYASNTKTLALQTSAMDEDVIMHSIPLDQPALAFDPSQYSSELKNHWQADGGHATYALLTRCFILVNATTSRIKIVDTLTNLLRIVIESDPDSLLPAVWLATNSISPPYIDLELGLGGSAITKALKKTCGLNNASFKALQSKYGDAGDVAFEAEKCHSFTLKKPKPLSIKNVYESLVRIANSKGHGSVQVKQSIVEKLILHSRGAEESRYIVRTLVQHLRIGAVKTTMLIALSRAFTLSCPPGGSFPVKTQTELRSLKKDELANLYQKREEIVKACFARHPNYADLVPNLLQVGVCDELLLRCGLSLHVPLRPMLGSITRDLADMLTRLQGRAFACEYKYDGQRAQVHCDESGKVSIFSRHLELMTEKYPDLVEIVPIIRGQGVKSFILEGEVVAVDKASGQLQSFQTLANRARKEVQANTVMVTVCLYAFDLMFLNGEELLSRTFRERRSLLRSLFTEVPGRFTWVQTLDAVSTDSEAVLDFYKAALELKCEGIMVKVLDNSMVNSDLAPPPAQASKLDGIADAPPPAAITPKQTGKAADKSSSSKSGARRKGLLSTYEPDKRLECWLKVKKDYSASADTLDLIPIGGWHGQGRKSRWWSPILLAARNPDSGQLVAITKCMSGYSDAFYTMNRARYDPDTSKNIISRPGYVDYAGEPEVWFEPHEVWEIAFADITMSPTYNAALGLVSHERGLSLRFPRFLRAREDKSIEEASTEQFVADLWYKQAAKPSAHDAAIDEAEEEEI